MASSSNPKSSSSASKRQKPTYRRASGSKSAAGKAKAADAKRSPAGSQPAGFYADPAPTSRQGGSYKVPSQRKRPGSVSAPAKQSPGRPAAAQTVAPAPRKTKGGAAGRTGATARKPPAGSPRQPDAGQQAARGARPRTLENVPAAARGSAPRRGGSSRNLFSRVPAARPRSGRAGVVVLVLAGVLVAAVLAVAITLNSGVFDAKTVVVSGTEHVEQELVEQLLEVPEGTSLLNVDEDAILASLQRSPWIASVEIERQWPDTLVITPVEYTAALLVYSSTDDVAWLVSSDSTWISPVSLFVATDEDGAVVELGDDGTWPEGATELSGSDAALVVAGVYGALLVVDIPSDVSPTSGAAVESEEVLACLAYASGFSSDFVAQIKNFSASSLESIAAILTNGVEVALGEAEDIATKEKVITKLLEEQEGVTYINVREADAYTFRSTPS